MFVSRSPMGYSYIIVTDSSIQSTRVSKCVYLFVPFRAFSEADVVESDIPCFTVQHRPLMFSQSTR